MISKISNLKSFSQSIEKFFLTVGQNNFGNKIPLHCVANVYALDGTRKNRFPQFVTDFNVDENKIESFELKIYGFKKCNFFQIHQSSILKKKY